MDGVRSSHDFTEILRTTCCAYGKFQLACVENQKMAFLSKNVTCHHHPKLPSPKFDASTPLHDSRQNRLLNVFYLFSLNYLPYLAPISTSGISSSASREGAVVQMFRDAQCLYLI